MQLDLKQKEKVILKHVTATSDFKYFSLAMEIGDEKQHVLTVVVSLHAIKHEIVHWMPQYTAPLTQYESCRDHITAENQIFSDGLRVSQLSTCWVHRATKH